MLYVYIIAPSCAHPEHLGSARHCLRTQLASSVPSTSTHEQLPVDYEPSSEQYEPLLVTY